MENENENVFNQQLTEGIENNYHENIQTPTNEEFKEAFDKVDEIIKNQKDKVEPEPISSRKGWRKVNTDNVITDEKLREVFAEKDDTTVRDLTKEESILNDIKKKKEKRSFTDEELKEVLLDYSFINDTMTRFNNLINEEAKDFLSKTRKAEEWNEDDEDPNNLFIKLIINDERDRMLFKEMLLRTSEKRRPIYVNFGDYDFFFEYFDNSQPVFTFNKKNFNFFFDDDVEKLKNYIKDNKCSFGTFSYFSSDADQERKIKLENIVIEVLKKIEKPLDKKENTKEELINKYSQTENKEEEKPEPQSEVPESPVKEKEFMVESNIITDKLYKMDKVYKVYKVKTQNNKEPIFVVTDNPGNIYSKISDVLSVKVMGNGLIC